MNRIYRSIWNEVSRTFVATAEIVRSRGKSASRSQGLDASLATLDAGDLLGRGGHPAQAPPASRLRSVLRPLALEQRFMFDGAAVATVDAHVNDVPLRDAAAIAEAFAAHAEQSAPGQDAGRAAGFVTEPVLLREAVPELNHGRREVVFIDTHVADYQSLLGGIGQGIEVRLIDGAQDGVAQIARWAETHSGYDAIHLFSHGTSGSVTLGSVSLSNANLDAYQNQLATIGAALTGNGDILVYGCKVAAGQPGVDLLGRLAEVTGADVAASTDMTGAAPLGGDWQLEYATGSVEAPSIDLSRDYAGILGTINMTGPVDAYSGTNGEADIFVLPAEAANGTVLYTAWGGLYNNNGQWHLLNNIIVISNFDVSQDKIDMSALGAVIDPSNVPNYAIKVAYGTDFSTWSSYDINFTSAQYDGSTVSNWKGGTTGAWLEFNDDGGNPTLNAFFPGVDENTFTLANFIFPVAGPAAPGAPDLTTASDTGISSTDNITGDTTPTFTGSGASAGATIKLYESSTLLGTTTADGSGNWTITSSTLGAGTHSITAKQTVSGTESAASASLSVTIDTSAPTASVTSVAVKPGTSVTAAQSSETGKAYLVSSGATVTDLASLDALVTAGSAKSATVSTANSNTTLATTGLADGTYKVYSVDAGGNVSAASSGTVTIDNTAPTIGSVSAGNVNSAGGSTYDFTVTYADSGSGLDAASFDSNDITVTGPNSYSSTAAYVSRSGNTVTYRITPPGGTWDGADAGTYTIALAASQVRDTAGNYVAASANIGSFEASFNPAPVLTTPSAINLTDTAAADTFSNQSGTLSATDADGIASYGIQSPTSTSAGFVDGGLTYDISKAGTYGTLYLVSSGPDMGKYVYVPDAAAIDNLAAGAAPTDTFTVTATDANGSPATGSAVLTVNLSGSNDAPTLSATGSSPGFTENGAAVSLFSGVSVSAIEAGEKLDQLVLTVSNVANGSSEILSVDGSNVALTNGNSVTTASNGLTVGVSLSGGLATVTIGKSGGVPASTLQGVVSGLAYRNTSESPATTDRVVTLTSVRDVGGTANGGADTAALSITSTIAITGVNDAPTDITVSTSTINQSAAGVGASVATLGVLDLDVGDTHGYALVSGTGDTNNNLFVVDGGVLKVGNTALTPGSYNLRLRVTDSGTGSLAYEKAVTITVSDDVGPTFDAAGSVPADGAAGVAPSANLQLSFNEAIALGASGTIELRDLTTNTVVQTWDLSNPAHVGAGNGQVSVSGMTLTLNPTASLAEATHYAIRISTSAIEDSAGNPFAGIGDDTTLDFSTGVTDSAAPVLQSIQRGTPVGETTNSGTLTFTLKFNEAVTGADTADFQLSASGTAGGTLSQVTGNGSDTLTLTVTGVTGTGTLGIDLAGAQNITDIGGNALANGDPASDQVFNVDRDLPSVISINRIGNDTSVSGSTAQFLVIFSEAVKNVSAADFSLVAGGTVSGQIAAVSGSGTAAIVVTVNNLGGAGSLGLSLAGGYSVDDLAGNALGVATPDSGVSETYLVDADAPTAVSITRLGDALTNATTLSFQVVFNEPVNGVDAADFVLSTTGSASGTIASVSGSAGSYTVSVTGVSGSGSLGLAFAGSQNITDEGGRAFAGTLPSLAETYRVDNSLPDVTAINRAGVNQIAAGTPSSAVFTVVFSEAVSGLSAADFTVTGSAANTGISSVSSTDGKVFQVTVGGVNGSVGQTLGLDFTGSVSDALAQVGSASFTTGQQYTIGGLLLNEGALDQAALDALLGVNRDGMVKVVAATGPATEVVIIDSRVPGLAEQLGQVRAGVDVWLLDAGSSATAQISSILSGYSGLAAVHLVSHGSSGEVHLGAENLSSATLPGYTATLAAWGNALSGSGDLLVYGCDVGKGVAGSQFVAQLAQAIGADVAASDDLTGASWLGGDWVLEVAQGNIDAPSIVVSAFNGTLIDPITFDFTSGTVTDSGTVVTQKINGVTLTTTILNASGNTSSTDVTVSGGKLTDTTNQGKTLRFTFSVPSDVSSFKVGYSANSGVASSFTITGTEVGGGTRTYTPSVATTSGQTYLIDLSGTNNWGNLTKLEVSVASSGVVTFFADDFIMTPSNPAPSDIEISSTLAPQGVAGVRIANLRAADTDQTLATDTVTFSEVTDSSDLFTVSSSGVLSLSAGKSLANGATASITIRATDSVSNTYDETFTITGGAYTAFSVASSTEYSLVYGGANVLTASYTNTHYTPTNSDAFYVLFPEGTAADVLYDDADETYGGWIGYNASLLEALDGYSALSNGQKIIFLSGSGSGIDTFAIRDQYYVVTVGTADTTPPTFDVAPAASSIATTGFDLSASLDEAGKIYYVVVANGATAPTAAEVKAGTASGGGAALGSGNQAVASSPFSHTFSLSGLSAGTAYDVYVVAEDSAGTPNVMLSPTKLDVTTSAAPPVFSSGTTANFAENASGTVYDAELSSSSGTVTYSLSGADAGRFDLNTSTGVLSFKSAPDHEQPKDAGTDNVYNVTIRATDDNGSTDRTVAITVTDANDVNFSSADNASITGGTSLTRSVTAGLTANITFSTGSFLNIYAPGENAGFPGGIYAYSGTVSEQELVITAESGYTFDLGSFKIAPDIGQGSTSVKVRFTSGGQTYEDTYPLTLDGSAGYTLVVPSTHPVNDVTQVTLWVSAYAEFQDIEITDIQVLDVAPSFDVAPAASNIAATGFDLSASLDEAGKIYYVVVASGATAPTAAEVKAGTASGGGAALASGDTTVGSTPFTGSVSVSGLSAGTGYDVYVVAEDNAGTPNLMATPTKLVVTTSAAATGTDVIFDADGADVISPDVSVASATPSKNITITNAGETLNLSLTGGSSGFYVDTLSNLFSLLTEVPADGYAGKVIFTQNDDFTNSVTASITGKVFDLNSLYLQEVNADPDTFVITTNDGKSVTVNRAAGTGGVVDLSGNADFKGISSFTITTQDGNFVLHLDSIDLRNIHVPASDTTPPSFDVAPAASNIATTGFDLSASLDEAGKIYYVVVANGATAPTAAEVKAGTASGGGAALGSGNQVVVSSPFSHSFSLSGLSAGTDYDVYVVGEDDSGTPNVMASPVKVDVSTASSPVPTIANLADTLNYTIGSAAQIIDQGTAAAVTDGDSADFDTGVLTLSGVGTGDVIQIRNQGTGAGQIGVSGNDVTYEGTVIGTYSGGLVSTLTVTFNANASAAAVSALLQNLTYRNDIAESGTAHTLTLTLSDGDGNTSAPVQLSINATTTASTSANLLIKVGTDNVYNNSGTLGGYNAALDSGATSVVDAVPGGLDGLGTTFSDTDAIFSYQGKLYGLFGNPAETGRGFRFASYDGTEVVYLANEAFEALGSVTIADGKIFFVANLVGGGPEVYQFDVASSTLTHVGGTHNQAGIQFYAGDLYFFTQNYEVARWDGSAVQVVWAAKTNAATFTNVMVVMDSKLYFGAQQPVGEGPSNAVYNAEIYAYDAATGNVSQLTDRNAATNIYSTEMPKHLVVHGDKVFFAGTNSADPQNLATVNDHNLISVDGSGNIVTEFSTGNDGWVFGTWSIDGSLYFAARLGGDTFTNLYKYNATGSATNLTGFTSGTYSISDVTAYAAMIYFTVSVPEGGGGLYRYDGTTVSQVGGFPSLNTGGGIKETFDPGLVVFDHQLAPVVTNTADLVGIVAGASTLVSPALTVTDIDSSTLNGATVTVTVGKQAADTLTFTAASGITGSYDSDTGVLTLSGTATAAQYQAVLRSVTFNASATAGQREFQFRVTDGEGNQSWGNSPAGRAYIAVAEAGSSVTTVGFDTDPTAGGKVGTVDIADSNLGSLQVIAPLDGSPTPTYGIEYSAGTASLTIVSDWNANPNLVTIKSANGAEFDLQGFRFTDSIDVQGDVGDLVITGFKDGAQTTQTTVRINLYGPQTTVILPTGFNNVDEVRIESGADTRNMYSGGAFGGLLDDIMVLSRPSGPSIASATYDASTGTLAVTTTGLTAGNAIDETRLTLKGEGGATYTLTESGSITATSETSFTIVLSAADKAAVSQILNKSGGSSTDATTYNLAAAADWYGSGNADLTGNAVTVASVPLPAITSATYDAGTGVLVVTGSGFTRAAGAANDIDVTKLSLIGTGGGASAFTLTGDTSDVEISSDTEFTITLGSADRAALNAILNVNGTEYSAGNLYNLAAADDWARGADAALTITDGTSGVTVSGNNPAPVLTTPTTISLNDTAAADSFSNQTGTLSATDADGVASYGIQGGTAGSYTVDGDSFQVSKAGSYGSLYVNSSTGAYVFVPDAAAISAVAGGATPSETFTVTATDGHASPATGSATLTVEVSGANDTPATPTLDGSTSDSLAQSTASAGATVGALAATDAETGSLTYTLVSGAGSTDNARFSIDGGSLKVGGSALEAGSYSVRVRVTDAGTPAAAWSEQVLTITVTDDVAPTFIGNQSAPADNATGVAPTASLVLKFSETIVAGSGTVSLVNVTTGAVVETFDVATGIGSAGGSLSISGDTLSLDPGSDLAQSTQYAVQVPAAVVKDGADNPFGGTSGNTSYNFTTGSTDTTAPSVTIVEVGDPIQPNAGSVTVRFSEPVQNVDISAFRLTRDGVPVDISGLTLSGSGNEYSLDLGSVTGVDGEYVLTLDPSLASTPITDSSGNALPLGATDSFTIDTTAPSGATIVRASASPTSASGVNFTVVFGEAVSGVDAADFELVGSATGGASIAGVTRISDSVYSVAVSGLSGSGTLGLNLKSSGTGIADRAGNALAGGATGQLYTLDAGLPAVLSITRNSQEVTAADSVSFTVSFNEAVSGVDATDFIIDKGDGVTASSGDVSVSGSGTTYTVTVANVAGDGRLSVDLKASGTGIIDGTSHAISGGFSSGESYLIDNTLPVISASQSFDLPENMGTGFVIGQVRVSDANRVTGYSIVSGNADGYFAVDADGVITLTAAGAAAGAASSDYETTPNSFTLGVVATDEAGNASASVDVGIQVLDEEENQAPVVAAPLTSAADEGDSAYDIDLLDGASDPDAGDVLAVSAVTYTVDGVATGNAGADLPGGLSRTDATLSVDPDDAAFDDLAAGETRVIVVSYQVADGNGGSVAQTATLTITGSNDTPTVTAGTPTATLVEAGGVANGTAGIASSTISLSKGDLDGTAEWDSAWLLANGWSTADAGLTYTKAGTYGTATFTVASGQVAYALDDADSDTQALAAGASVTDSFSVQVSDGSATASVAAVFQISGSNDTPTVTAGTPTATLVEAGGVSNGTAGTASSTISLSKGDLDGTAEWDSVWLLANGWSTADAGLTYTKAGTYGTATFTVASGQVAYALDDADSDTQALAAGASVTDSFSVQVSDGSATASVAAVFQISGSNDTPTVTAGTPTATLVEAGGVANGTAGTASSTISLSKGDLDGTAEWDSAWLLANGWSTADAGLTYTKAGTYGTATFTVASGQVAYALDDADSDTQALAAGASVTDSFSVQVSDGSATASV
ncbi:DUF4347 domain-containing protein, partial [Zoogloea dura]